jgi:RND family efflux transporter MFP subunit
MNRIQLRRLQRAAAPIVLVLAIVVAGCKGPAAPPPPPPPGVTVSRPVQHDVIEWDQFSGYLSSPKTVTVNARVSGLIVQAPFQEGAIVHAGDLLFKIDPRPFQADLDNKEAAVAQARATTEKTNADFARSTILLKAEVVARADYDSTKASFGEADASLKAAEAALEISRLNLEWTEVRAPITGRVSRMNVTVGNLVTGGTGQATPTTLTTIVSIDPLYCYINVPQSVALRFQQLALQEKQSSVAGARVACYMQLENETNFPREGVIDFVDNQVDVSTGTVQIRCVFANPTSILTPGLFALTRIPASGRYQALLIPDAAVNSDQNERYLLVVGANDVVQQRPVKLGALFGNLRSITDGLKPNERVIVNGMLSAMPGAKVNPHEVAISTESLDALESIAAGSQPAQAPETGAGAQSDSQQAAGAGQ